MAPKRSSAAARHIRWSTPIPQAALPGPAEPPPEMKDWRELWEWYAERTRLAYLTWSEDDLLDAIGRRRYDTYYQIWAAIRERGTLARSAPVLIEVLRREVGGTEEMLLRYHAAGALFSLLGERQQPPPPLRERVQWDRDGEPARQRAIKELEQLVRQRTGS